MKLLQEILQDVEARAQKDKTVLALAISLEHNTYKQLPGTKNSYRIDAQNTTTKTQKHAHIYARQNGGGKQLYSVNLDGSGHDGSSGTIIPFGHAEYLRSLGFEIPPTLSLESINFSELNPNLYEICILEDKSAN